ncbi:MULTISPECIES: ABC transporter permease [Lachnospiraceae]
MKRKMQKLVAQLAGILIVLLGVTLLSFSLMYIAPGDPARTILQAGGTMPSEEAVQEKRKEMGLDRPFLEQYGSWLWSFVHGDLGVSMIDGRNVSDEVTKALGKSAVLAVTSLAAGVAAALPLGVMSAARKEKMFDRITCFFVFIRLCMPSFLVGIGFLYLFAYRLKLISISGSGGASALILPAATLATGICARMIRQIRTLIYEEIKHPYVDGLRSRGIRETQILFVHILRNAMLPIITMIALSFGELLGGTAITEIIFSWPGIGRLVMTAIEEHDYTIIQGFVVVIALIFFVIYGLTELSYSLFDPRVKKQKESSRNG